MRLVLCLSPERMDLVLGGSWVSGGVGMGERGGEGKGWFTLRRGPSMLMRSRGGLRALLLFVVLVLPSVILRRSLGRCRRRREGALD